MVHSLRETLKPVRKKQRSVGLKVSTSSLASRLSSGYSASRVSLSAVSDKAAGLLEKMGAGFSKGPATEKRRRERQDPDLSSL